MAVIERRRPGIPTEYGISSTDDGMLEWANVAETLVAAPVFWISTGNADGYPHLIPIWGAWTSDAGYIEGGDMAMWARNLTVRPRVHMGVDHEGRQIMVRGNAAKTDVDAPTQDAIADAYAAKYPYRPQGSTFWEIRPRSVLAWDTNTLDSFATTPTEFLFEEAT